VFPVEFPFSRAVAEPALDALSGRYVVGAMMTPSHAHLGERLASSCRAYSLPLALYEVPFVHRSISPAGIADLRYTKANFVRFLMQRYGHPVLYLDVDCVIVQRPSLFDQLLTAGVDFAIFNWLAEEHTEAYVPADITVPGEVVVDGEQRFYRFSHSIDAASKVQLLCSGAVQWYHHTAVAWQLLELWQSVIERAPGCADDNCLDFACNNFPREAPPLKAMWLDKSYARYAWWIYQPPVIDHPEFPRLRGNFEPLDEMQGRRRIYTDTLELRNVKYAFPKDCLIDTKTRTLLRLRDGVWHTLGPFSTPLWLRSS
jgi:hypothetical protein